MPFPLFLGNQSHRYICCPGRDLVRRHLLYLHRCCWDSFRFWIHPGRFRDVRLACVVSPLQSVTNRLSPLTGCAHEDHPPLVLCFTDHYVLRQDHITGFRTRVCCGWVPVNIRCGRVWITPYLSFYLCPLNFQLIVFLICEVNEIDSNQT